MYAPRLREWREAQGETQKELAERSGVAEHTISRVENGAGLTPPTARKLAGALGISVVDLLESPPSPLAGAPSGRRPSPKEETKTGAGLEDVLEAWVEGWVDYLDRDAERLEELAEPGSVDSTTYEQLSLDRRKIVQSLDDFGERLKALGIDLLDRRNPRARRAYDALFRSFSGWAWVWQKASDAHLDAQARAEEEELLAATREKLAA
jgi:transcriptional regulator with XRE-family HTH domain